MYQGIIRVGDEIFLHWKTKCSRFKFVRSYRSLKSFAVLRFEGVFYFSRFETLTSWLASNEASKELKEKLLANFDLKKFSSHQLLSLVRESFAESSILEVLSHSVSNLEDKVGKLEEKLGNEKIAKKIAIATKIQKIEAENDSLKRKIKFAQIGKEAKKKFYCGECNSLNIQNIETIL